MKIKMFSNINITYKCKIMLYHINIYMLQDKYFLQYKKFKELI